MYFAFIKTQTASCKMQASLELKPQLAYINHKQNFGCSKKKAYKNDCFFRETYGAHDMEISYMGKTQTYTY